MSDVFAATPEGAGKGLGGEVSEVIVTYVDWQDDLMLGSRGKHAAAPRPVLERPTSSLASDTAGGGEG